MSKYKVALDSVYPEIAEYWVEIDPKTKNPIGKPCWAYYSGDRPSEGYWIKVREIEGVNNLVKDTDPASIRK